MALIDKTYFVGELNIPDTDNASEEERLNFFIAKYEVPFLREVLGNALYKAYKDGIANVETAEQKWKDLQNGCDYTDQSGRSQYWEGLRNAETKQSLIAGYVYYWWLRDKSSLTTPVGEVQSEPASSKSVAPTAKMVRAWNEIVEGVRHLVAFLDANIAAYPEWEEVNRFCVLQNYSFINALGI